MDCHPLRWFLKNQASGTPELKNLFAELIAETLTDGETLAAIHPDRHSAEILSKVRSEISCRCSASAVFGKGELDGRLAHGSLSECH